MTEIFAHGAVAYIDAIAVVVISKATFLTMKLLVLLYHSVSPASVTMYTFS
jgi:hypothetical protein